MGLDLNHFRKKLEEERLGLEEQLKSVARLAPDNSKDWQPIRPEMNPQTSEASEMADVFEEMETQNAREVELEARLSEVKEALERIEKGTYGFCGVDQRPIPEARLEANPAAKTCIEHSN